MTYFELVDLLKDNAEDDFARFQRKLIFTKQTILGVRTPTLRKIAKLFKSDEKRLLSFPDEYYEVTFIKLTAVSNLPFERFVEELDYCVSLMDNWATCDSFKAKCIKRNRDVFLPILQDIFNHGGIYYERYPLVVLLNEYVEEKYRGEIKKFILFADTKEYYIHMAVAWLIAEILIKDYPFGVSLLTEGVTDVKTHNKAIQKAVESYRLDEKTKEYLRSLKIK